MYDWIKALHVIAVISWMAGMLYLPRLFEVIQIRGCFGFANLAKVNAPTPLGARDGGEQQFRQIAAANPRSMLSSFLSLRSPAHVAHSL